MVEVVVDGATGVVGNGKEGCDDSALVVGIEDEWLVTDVLELTAESNVLVEGGVVVDGANGVLGNGEYSFDDSALLATVEDAWLVGGVFEWTPESNLLEKSTGAPCSFA